MYHIIIALKLLQANNQLELCLVMLLVILIEQSLPSVCLGKFRIRSHALGATSSYFSSCMFIVHGEKALSNKEYPEFYNDTF